MSVADVVRGPGAVFDSIDEAAADALAWCYLRATRRPYQGRAQAGVIFEKEGGYTYGKTVTARAIDPGRVKLVLRPNDVAHFRVYPPANSTRAARAVERHSRTDREAVSQDDPLHRASYLLTPRRSVRVYAGQGEEWRLGSLREWATAAPTWGRPTVRIEEGKDG
jgi:hypothetical protein